MVIVTGGGHQAQRLGRHPAGRCHPRVAPGAGPHAGPAGGRDRTCRSRSSRSSSSGRSRPSMRSLFRIATALGTTQQALLGPGGARGHRVARRAAARRRRLLLHDRGGADVTEFADIAARVRRVLRASSPRVPVRGAGDDRAGAARGRAEHAAPGSGRGRASGTPDWSRTGSDGSGTGCAWS